MTDSGAVRRAGLLVLLLLLACAKKATRAEAQLPPDPKDELKAKVAELYEALEQLEPERLNALLTPEPLVYGLGPKQTFTNRDTLVESLRAELVPFGLRGDAFKVSGAAPRVGLAPGGGSGWFYDFPRFEQQRSGKAPKQWNVRITGHAVHDDARWRFDAVHVSFGFPDTQLYAPDANKKLKAPEPAGQLKTADCEPLLSLNKRMLDDIAVKVERTSDADEVVLIGTDPTDVFEGGAKFKALARPKLPELKRAAFSLRLEDGPRARLANDGKSAWVSGSVVLRLGRGGKQQTLPAFRALWIFALENDGWRLVSEHQSLGLPDELRVPVGG
ncbi:MAG: nuclear transport factor 2 family protein [Archangiaceae bacterium]|nr:nuclear transport factor 2 family protein [Archangiaceae bacterium]